MTTGKITSKILLSHWKVVFGSHFLDTGLSYCTALCALIQKEAPQTQLLDSTPWQQTNHLQIYLFERKLETEGIVVMSYWGTDARIYLFLKHVCTKTSSKPHCCLHYVFIYPWSDVQFPSFGKPTELRPSRGPIPRHNLARWTHYANQGDSTFNI